MKRELISAVIIAGAFLVATISPAAGGQAIEGSGVMKSEKRVVGAFSSLDLSGAFTTEVTCQKEQRIEIRGDDNIVPIIRAEVREGRLFIYPTKPYTTSSKLLVTITVPDIKEVAVSGANTITVNRVSNASLRLEAGGASTFSVSGKTGRLDAELSGGANLNADSLVAENVAISVSGAGDAEVNAVKKLDVRVTGVGNVAYRGNPEVSRQILGVGSVYPR